MFRRQSRGEIEIFCTKPFHFGRAIRAHPTLIASSFVQTASGSPMDRLPNSHTIQRHSFEKVKSSVERKEFVNWLKIFDFTENISQPNAIHI